MKLRYKVLSVIVILVAAGVLSLALYVSHSSPCTAAPPLPAGAATMKAAVRRCYGSPDVVHYEEIAKPNPSDHDVLVRLHAASVNPLDFHYVEGTPYLVRTDPEAGFGAPRNPQLGVDFAGTIEAVGRSVTRFKVGDEVFGGQHGAFAEYLVVPEDGPVALKPSSVTFEQAAALPIAGITALQALRDHGQLHAGQKVLINGASGGVGTFAVQIAKSMGAEVTGVCSAKNLELVRSIGADHVIDYTREDFTRGTERYDLIVDNVATHSAFAYRRVLNPNGTYLMIGSTDFGHWLGFLANPLEGKVLSWASNRKFSLMGAHLDHDDLERLAALVQSGKLTPVIDRRYPLSEAAEALAYVEKGHARGKVILTVE
jgi:NADPH:quinone reductase-like Zn-dependent oxidoreductase